MNNRTIRDFHCFSRFHISLWHFLPSRNIAICVSDYKRKGNLLGLLEYSGTLTYLMFPMFEFSNFRLLEFSKLSNFYVFRVPHFLNIQMFKYLNFQMFELCNVKYRNFQILEIFNIQIFISVKLGTSRSA